MTIERFHTSRTFVFSMSGSKDNYATAQYPDKELYPDCSLFLDLDDNTRVLRTPYEGVRFYVTSASFIGNGEVLDSKRTPPEMRPFVTPQNNDTLDDTTNVFIALCSDKDAFGGMFENIRFEKTRSQEVAQLYGVTDANSDFEGTIHVLVGDLKKG